MQSRNYSEVKFEGATPQFLYMGKALISKQNKSPGGLNAHLN